MCHEYETANCYALVPNEQSDYSKGTWKQLASIPANAPVNKGGHRMNLSISGRRS
jgi:hypothetical protein